MGYPSGNTLKMNCPMKPALRYTLYGAGGLVVLGGASLAYIAATFDPNALKPRIEQLVKDKKQRTLTLEGPISLSFFPSLGATLSDVTLSERGSEAPFASVGNARVALQFWPLLHKRVVVDAIELEGASATLVRAADGTLNIADLLSPNDQDPSTPVDFDISRVRISNVKLTFDDRLGHRKIVLDQLALAADGLSRNGANHVEASVHAKLTSPMADLKLSSSLDQLEASSDGKQLSLTKLAMAVDGTLGAEAVKLKLDAPHLSLKGDALAAEPIDLAASLEGTTRKLDARLKLDGLSGTARQLAAKSLGLELNARQGSQSSSLTLASPLSINLDAQAIALPRLALSGKAAGGTADAAFMLNGHVNAGVKAEAANAALSGKVDGTDFALTAAVKGFSQPALTLALNAGELDLDRYFPPAPADTKPAEPAGTPLKLDLSPLKPLNLNATLAIARLKKAPIDARNVKATVIAKGGVISLPSLSLQAFGGDIAASGSASASAEPKFSIKPRLSHIDIHALLNQLAHFDRLDGHGDVDGDLSAQGATVAALKASAAGKLSLRLADGAVRGINLAKLVREAKSAIGSLQGGQQTVANNDSEKTDFTELSASLQLNQGVAHNNDLSLKSPLLRVTGEGEADLNHETLDYLVKASLVNTDEGQGGKDRGQLKGLTIPVRVKGPFTAPVYSLDLSAAIKENAGAKVDEKKRELKDKAVDALKKGLGNLFK
jgi:AsmA protein